MAVACLHSLLVSCDRIHMCSPSLDAFLTLTQALARSRPVGPSRLSATCVACLMAFRWELSSTFAHTMGLRYYVGFTDDATEAGRKQKQTKHANKQTNKQTSHQLTNKRTNIADALVRSVRG